MQALYRVPADVSERGSAHTVQLLKLGKSGGILRFRCDEGLEPRVDDTRYPQTVTKDRIQLQTSRSDACARLGTVCIFGHPGRPTRTADRTAPDL